MSEEIHIVLESLPWLRIKWIVDDFTYVISDNLFGFKDNVLFWISHLIFAIQMVFQSMVLEDVVGKFGCPSEEMKILFRNIQ